MPKIDLNLIKAQMFQRTESIPQHALICPHGMGGTGKTTLWGQFGRGKPGRAAIAQAEVGDRDLDNPDIFRLNINTMFNIGRMGDIKEVDGEIIMGDFENLENAALGWDYVRTITEELIKNGGRSINPMGIPFEYFVWDSGTAFQKMCLAWVMRNTPTRNRPPGPEGGIRPSKEDYGDLVFEYDDWMMKQRDLKRRMTIVVTHLTFEVKTSELAPDGNSLMDVMRYMPMLIGKKLPAQIVSYADFAPFHQMVEQNVMVDDPANPGKKKVAVKMVRGLRWQPTMKIYAKGRGKLPPVHGLLSPDDIVGDKPIGWECHYENLRRICEAGNIPL